MMQKVNKQLLIKRKHQVYLLNEHTNRTSVAKTINTMLLIDISPNGWLKSTMKIKNHLSLSLC
jgi:hypothetical protein